MVILIAFAFLGGVVTILSPCILPLLPIILSGSVGEGKRRPIGIIFGFIVSFSFFTLFLSAVVSRTGISADTMRLLAVIILMLFGLSLIIPRVQLWIEGFVSRLSSHGASSRRSGFVGGLLLGASLGLIWTPCVGPILAAVITLALSEAVTSAAVVITVAYALGTALPMFAIMQGGRALLKRMPGLTRNAGRIQQVFGGVMVVVALAILFNWDRQFQSWILDRLPGYGQELTGLEQTKAVDAALDELIQE